MGRDQLPLCWLLAVSMLLLSHHPTSRRIVLAWRNSSPLLFQQGRRCFRNPRGPPRGSFFTTSATAAGSRRGPNLVRGLASESFSRSRQDEPQLRQEDNAAAPDGATTTADALVYKELEWVAAELRKHDALYYNDVDSALDDAAATFTSITEPITDAEYDALAAREAELCQAHPELWHRLQAESGLGPRATRYKGRVGAVHDASSDDEDEEEEDVVVASSMAAEIHSTNRLKQAHLKPMLSLDNVHDTDQLVAWLERVRKKLLAEAEGEEEETTTVTIVTEPKLDGLSLSLRYELESPDDGGDSSYYELKWACTRGDGRKGTDVTRAVREMGTVPTRFRMEGEATELPDVVEVRGEVVLPHSVFEKLQNDQGTANEDEDAGSGSSSILASFSNARNAASGILLRFKEQEANEVDNKDDDASLTESQELRAKLRFYAYNVVTSSSNEEAATDPLVQNGLESRRILDALGFTTPDPISITTLTLPSSNDTEPWSETDVATMIGYYEALREYRQEGKASSRSTSKKASSESYEWGDFEVDGCVHKIAEESLRTRLGSSTRAPRWAVAHKFPPTAVVTDLLGIDIQVGRTGALTPVAILKPVEIGGVTVQRATLHNFPQMQHMLGGVDRILKGSSLMVRRAGDVIPQVMSRVSSSQEIEKSANTDGANSEDFISLQTPSSCPVCGSMASFDDKNATSSRNESSIGQVLRCRGPPLLCPPRAIGALRHAFARDALDIKGLSEKRIEQLMNAGFLERPSDIFTLANDEAKLEELADLAGWGEKSVSKLATEVKRVASEGVTLARFIYSLGIHLGGRHASPLIAEAYGTVDAFLEDLEKTSELNDMEESPFMRLDSIKGIGPVLLTSIWDFASQKELVVAARQLAQSVRILDETSIGTGSSGTSSGTGSGTTDSTEDGGGTPLSGLSVVFTGTIPGLTRSEAKKLAKEMGAKSTPGTVSKSTGLVVSGEKEGMKKVEQAQKLGVRLIDGDEFLKMVDAFRGGKSD